MAVTTLDRTAALIVIDLQKGIIGLPTAHPATGLAVSVPPRHQEKHSIPIESGPAQFNPILSGPLRPVCYCSQKVYRRSAADRILDVIALT